MSLRLPQASPTASALQNNGTVVAWGANGWTARRMCPPGLSNVVSIAAGAVNSLGP